MWIWQGSTTAWANGRNWQTAGSEPGSSNRAVFNTAAANPPTIVGSASVLGVDFQTGGWQINGSGSTLTIGAGGLTSTSNTGGTNTINSNVTLGGSQTWTTSSGNTVVVNGAMTFGASTLTKDGPGTLTLGTTGLSTTYSAGSALNLSGGTLNLLSAGGDNSNRNLAVTVNNATLAVGRTQYLARLTLTSSGAGVDQRRGHGQHQQHDQDRCPLDWLDEPAGSEGQQPDRRITRAAARPRWRALVNLIKSGGGTKAGDNLHYDWNGTGGITSSVLTYVRRTAALICTCRWASGTTASTCGTGRPRRRWKACRSNRTAGTMASIAVKYTWMGDMDLDGKVTVKDYDQFIHYYFNNPGVGSNPGTAADITWMTGDFNYDGKISVQDYNWFIQGYFYAQGKYTLSADEQIPNWAPIPEPATLVLLALGTAAVLRRRSRKA